MNAPQLWQELGNTYLKLAAYDRAVSAYRKVAEPFEDNQAKALGWRTVADLYLELNEPDLAAEAFMQAAKLFVAKTTNESPRLIAEEAVAEVLTSPSGDSVDQTTLEIDPSATEVLATAEAPLPEPSLAEQQDDQSQAAPVEQLPLGIPGYETIAPVSALVNEQVEVAVVEAAVEVQAAQLELNLDAVEPEAEIAVEAAASAESVDLEFDSFIAEEPELVEVEAIAETVAESTEPSLSIESPAEAVAEVEASAPENIQDADLAISEEPLPEPVEMQMTTETASQPPVVEEVPAEVSSAIAESAPALESVVEQELVAETQSSAPEADLLPVVEAVVSEEPGAEESLLVTEVLSVTEPVASTFSDAAEPPQALVTEEQVVESTQIEEAAASLEMTSDNEGATEEIDLDGMEPIASEPLQVSIDDIAPNPYIILHTAGMDELVDTIQKEGLTHPLIVTPNVWNNKYLLLVGEWRLEAARRAGLQVVPVLVRDVNPKEFLELTLLQNVQQSYLNPLELAQLYQFLVKDFNLSTEAIAERVGRSPLAVENTLRLRSLTGNGKKALIEHVISEDHAQALLYLGTPEIQDEVLQAILENEMSVQRTMDYVSEINAHGSGGVQAPDQKPAIEIIVENEVMPNTDVAWLENNSPDNSGNMDETVESNSGEGAVAETSFSDAVPEVMTTIVDGDANFGDDPGEPEFPNPNSMPGEVESEIGYRVNLPGTLVEIRKNALMAWKLESDPLPAAVWTAPVKVELASQSAPVAVLNQTEQVTNRTIFLPDTNVIQETLNAQALATAVEEVVIPVVEVANEEVPVMPGTLIEQQISVAEEVVETSPQPFSSDDAPSIEAAATVPEVKPRSREEDAVAVYKRVTELNPTNDRAWHMLGNLLLDLGRHDEAVTALEVAISLNATRDIYYYHLGIAQAVQKNYDDAVQSFEKALALNPENIFAHCSIIGYYRKLGREAEAKQHFQIVAPNIRLEKAYNRACFESICGNTDRALELLRQAIENDRVPIKWVERDPDLDLVRDDPRYKALIALVAPAE